MSGHHALLGDLRRFQAAAASAARTVGAPHSQVRARLADEAAAWQTCLDLLSDPGVYAIAVERRRQVEVEGFSAELDDAHGRGEMARAAAAYALVAATSGDGRAALIRDFRQPETPGIINLVHAVWPPMWRRSWFKPQTPLRDLARAGALAAAEISRLLRKAGRDD